MSDTLIDTCVLLDVLTEDEQWGAWSGEVIRQAGERGRLVINKVIYAEVSMGFKRIEEVDAALPVELFAREDIPDQAAFLAGKAFLAYRRHGGAKTSPLPDFFIGAHAMARGLRLATRDAARFHTYFPGVELIAPQ